MGSPLQAIMSLLQAPKPPQPARVRTTPDGSLDIGSILAGSQILPTQKSPYERTLRPGETRSAGDVQDMLAEVILAAGSGALPGAGPRGQARQAPAAKTRGVRSPVVYHGTTEPLEKLNVPKGRGLFFTDKPADAAVFAGSGTFSGEGYSPATSGANIIPAKVTFRKPSIIDMGGRLFDPKQMDRLVARAEGEGADGLVIRNIRNFPGAEPSTSYVALKPGLVRSAITKKRM